MAKKHYRLDSILKAECPYNIIYGLRKNGKSYAVKEYCIEKALKENRKFVYIRRMSEDIKPVAKVVKYFADMPIAKYTKGEFNEIECKWGDIYLAYRDGDGKINKRKLIGYYAHLSGATHYKSQSFPDVYYGILEEFLTDEGYLLDEPDKLMSIVSTFIRNNEDGGKVFLIGNTDSRQCPYITEWGLKNFGRQKENTIDVYEVVYPDGNIKIAVEYCGNNGQQNKLILGNAKDAIVSGKWKSKAFPKPPKEENSIMLLRVLIKWEGYNYTLNVMETDKGEPYVKVAPREELDTEGMFEVVVSKEFTTNYKYRTTLNGTIVGSKIRKLYTLGKFCYADNLTGTEFTRLIKEWSVF